MGPASRSILAAALAGGLFGCGMEMAPPAALPAPQGKYIAYIDGPSGGEQLYVVDSGVPNVVHRLNAALAPGQRVDRFVVSPDGQRIAYVTFKPGPNREDLYFTSLATPQRAKLLQIYADQGVAKVAFSADSQRVLVLLAHRGPTPPVQLPPGFLLIGDPADLTTVYSIPHGPANTPQDDTTNFVFSNDGLEVIFSGVSGMFRTSATIPQFGPLLAFSGPFSADGDFFGLSRDGNYLLASHFSIYAGPSDASAPTVEIVNGCCGAAQAGGIAANDDASHIAFLMEPPFPAARELRLTSRNTPGGSTLVTLADPDYQPWSNPIMLPGTDEYVINLVDPTQAGTAAWIGLHVGDASTGATPTLLGASNEGIGFPIHALDADDVLYFGTPGAGGATQLRQANLATPGVLIDLASPPLGSGPSEISVCGNTVAFVTVGIPQGIWTATVGQANSGAMVAATVRQPLGVTCLP
jgi:hypothetical protein